MVGNGHGAGTLSGGYSGDGGPATSAELYWPTTIAFDATGNMYIADWRNNVIRKVTFATSIDKSISSNEQINIYPNPSKSNFVLQTNEMGKQIVNIYDVRGQIILNQTINGTASIDVSNLNEGIYTVAIKTSDGLINKKLLILR